MKEGGECRLVKTLSIQYAWKERWDPSPSPSRPPPLRRDRALVRSPYLDVRLILDLRLRRRRSHRITPVVVNSYQYFFLENGSMDFPDFWQFLTLRARNVHGGFPRRNSGSFKFFSIFITLGKYFQTSVEICFGPRTRCDSVQMRFRRFCL